MKNFSLKPSIIQSSGDYKRFKKISYNRKTEPSRIFKIKESMEKHGNIVPIIVTPDGYIIDGQNRFEATKLLKGKVKFYCANVSKTALPHLITIINSTAKTWKVIEYFDMWLAFYRHTDKKKYEQLDWLKKRSEEQKIDMGLMITYFLHRKSDDIRKGSLSLTGKERDEIEVNCQRFNEIRSFNSEFLNFRNQKVFITAIIMLIRNKDYNHEHFMKNLEKYSGKLRSSSTRKDYIAMLESIYNMHRRNKIVI